MKVLKKALALTLSAVLAVSLVACGGGKGDSNSTDTSGATGGGSGDFAGQTLDVGIWGGNDQETRSIEQVKADFEAATGATVNFKVYTEYNVQIEADFVAKTAPDVFYVDANMFDYFNDLGVLDALDSAEMDADKFYPNMIDAFTGEDGELYAMPKDLSTLAMYYNTDILEKVGMSESDIPDSLEEMEEFLPTLQDALDEEYGKGQVAAMTYNLELSRNLHLLTRDGAQTIDENDHANIENKDVLKHLNFIKSLVDTGAYKRPADLGAGWNGEAFGTGQVAIMEEGNWVYGTLQNDFSDINFGVKDMPSYEGEKSSMLFTVGYAVYTESDKKDLAKEWIKYATGEEGMYTWCSGVGTLPSRDDVAAKLNLEEEPALATHLAQVEYAIPWQMGQYSAVIDSAYQNFMLEAMNGNTSVEEAAKQVDEQANQQIENG